ncbi:MAG: DEAD/DEAH box helicase [Treponema sp.]|jgi:ATP-dependent Lhr-like helicase|nr:DEAD/DEAH box helicase [Treponema sp.]
MFNDLIDTWFKETYGSPTAVQAEAWPLIEKGENVLALAPTGSGKTLTAFLGVLSRFCNGDYDPGELTVLYVSPLKALNEDIKRNLLEPLEALRKRFADRGSEFPPIRVETRSGDTPQAERRRFIKSPSSILALTPESLAILLNSGKGRMILSTVKLLIIDEIHAVLGSKRGSFLSCQIDRLSLIAGNFQRVSLSATVRPPEAAAEFSGSGKYRVHIVSPPANKKTDFRVEFPETGFNQGFNTKAEEKYDNRYRAAAHYILERLNLQKQIHGQDEGQGRHSVLVFTDSRRQAERLCLFINREAESFFEGKNFQARQIAYTHHGSLSKEIRRAVEQGFAAGEISCVVATASLELGIDIGAVEEVILAGTPRSASSCMQRIGRSGHGVGRVSRGRLIPLHTMDLLNAAALERAFKEINIEETYPLKNPLDVLSQLILSLCTEQDRNVDELFECIKNFYVFNTLRRGSYDRVIKMLSGGYRIRDFKARLYFDKKSGELRAAPGTLQLLYQSGGVIASRGLYSLRLAGGEGGKPGTKIGELDEEFVWERRLGDSFDFGGRSWRINSISSEAVEVLPCEKVSGFTPFWRADAMFSSSVITKYKLQLLDYLAAGNTLPEEPYGKLNLLLAEQRNIQGSPGGSDSIPVEIIDDPLERKDALRIVIHSFRGGRINYPLSLALAEDLEEKLGLRSESFCDDNGILLLIPRKENSPSGIEILVRDSIMSMDRLEQDLMRGERLFRKRLESSGLFGAAFREAAERSLVLPRSGFGRRTPLWVMRQRSKRLFDEASGIEDFPLTAEAWRTCLQDDFDMEGFRDLITSLCDGNTGLFFFKSGRPSPFARSLAWQETAALIYEYDDRPELRGEVKRGDSGKGGLSSSLSDRVIDEALGDASLRPILPETVVEDFVSRLRREREGWTPEDETSLAEWIKERVIIPCDEWEKLCGFLPRQLKETLDKDPSLGGKIGKVKRNNLALPCMIHRELRGEWENDPLSLAAAVLRYEGPLSLSRISSLFGIGSAEALDTIESLAEEENLFVMNVSVKSGNAIEEDLVCDRENLELLLRLSRKKNRAQVKESPPSVLAPLFAMRQGLLPRNGNISAVESLYGYAAPVRLWETEFLACRSNYRPEILEQEIREGRLIWYGAGKEKIAFCVPENFELFFAHASAPVTDTKVFENSDEFFHRPRDFWEIKEASGLGLAECVEFIWKEVWNGRLSSGTWEALRKGIEQGFKAESSEEIPAVTKGFTNPAFSRAGRERRIPAALRQRWQNGSPLPGTWFSLDMDSFTEDSDPAYEDQLNRERVRELLKRYGIIARPLLEAESPLLSWRNLLPSIRRMELAGEIIAGRFVSGIDSLQFALPSIIRELDEAQDASFRDIYWMNAADPASPAGLKINFDDPAYRENLPSRLPLSRLCFRGNKIAAVSKRNGKELEIFTGPDDPDIIKILEFIKMPHTRSIHPEKKILIETINGQSAALSPYKAALKSMNFLQDRGNLILW